MRHLRSVGTALAVAVGLACAQWTPVAAQSTSVGQPITVSASVSGPAGSGVTAIRVSFLCKDLATALSLTTRTIDVPIGGTDLAYFEVVNANPTAVPSVPGSSCQITASLRGASGIGTGLVSILVGGVDRTGTQSIDSTGAAMAVSTIVNGNLTSTFVPITASTSVAVLVTYPVFVLRKAVVGTEAIAGAEYAMSVECFATMTIPFVETVGNAAGYRPGDLVVADRGSVVLTVAGSPVRVFDARATGIVAPDIVGTAAALVGLFPPSGGRSNGDLVTQAIYDALHLPARPLSTEFTLRRNGTRAISAADVPGLIGGSSCRFSETDGIGASLISSSAGGSFVPRGASTVFVSNLVPIGSTVTITNTFLGRLRVGVAVAGDPGSRIATFGVRVRCELAGIDDSFLLKAGQSKVYENITAGTVCIVAETKSDGASVTVNDNSGPAVSDGTVVIPVQGAGCGPGSPAITGAGSAVSPPADSCFASVMLTNTYGPSAAVSTPPAPPAGPIESTSLSNAPPLPPHPPVPAAATVESPPVTPAPATAVTATPAFTG